MFTAVKSMNRELTPDEVLAVEEYIRKNSDKSEEEGVAHFEKLFNMPVTKTCIRKVLVGMMMRGEQIGTP